MPLRCIKTRGLALLLAMIVPLATVAQSSASPDPAVPPTIVRHPKPIAARISSTNLNLIVLDPGHGGHDNGATLGKNLLEKDVTLALANRMRTLLVAQGFTVVLTRENGTDDVTADARVELANRSHPLACLLLHAVRGGHGVHLYSSALNSLGLSSSGLSSSAMNGAAMTAVAPAGTGVTQPIIPWDTAQNASLAQSLRLLNDLATGLNGIRVPIVTARASVQPIDSLTCPAVALEMAPLATPGDIVTPAGDAGYQQHVAEAVTQALVFWRGHAQSAAAAAQAASPQAGQPRAAAQSGAAPSTPATAAPKPKPKPKAIVPPVEVPDEIVPVPPAVPARKPAPIIRQAPAAAPAPAPSLQVRP